MSTDTKTNPIAKFGPAGAPLLGGVLLVAFVAVAIMAGDVGQQQNAMNDRIRQINDRLESQQPQQPKTPFPEVASVSRMLAAEDRQPYRPVAGESAVHNLPHGFKVNVVARELDLFEQYRDGKDHLNENDFKASGLGDDGGVRGEFKNWDVNGDRKISRAEFDNPPREAATFSDLDKDESKFLEPPEISQAELEAWDENFDGKVSPEEFERRNIRKNWVDIGAPVNVVVTEDLENMELKVEWGAPTLETMPSDATYILERNCPETFQQRKNAHNLKLLEYTNLDAAWERGFTAWWNGPADEAPEERRRDLDKYKDREAARAIYEQSNPRPKRPAEPEEWEEVARDLTDTTFTDRTFEVDATYIYAVRMTTAQPLKRGQKGDRVEDGRHVSARALQAGRPVRVRNRVAIGWGSSGGSDVTFLLSKWIKVGESDWYRVSLRERHDPNGVIGGEYNVAALKDRSAKARKAGSTEDVEIDTVLTGNVRMDFRTGFTFLVKNDAGALLSHREYGECELPRTVRDPAPPQPSPSITTSTEVRVLAVSPRGAEAWFEITRWHQVGADWYRVELVRKTGRGGEAGLTVNLASPGAGVRVFDSGGRAVPADRLRGMEGGSVDMNVGTYDGMTGRNIKLGTEQIDFNGALFR